MPCIVKTFLRVCLLPLMLCIVNGAPLSAHESRPAIVDVDINQDGKIRVLFKFDFRGAIEQFSGKKSDNDADDNYLNETAKTAAEYKRLLEIFEVFKDRLLIGVLIKVDGKQVSLQLIKATIPKNVKKGSNRIAAIILEGALPIGAKELIWQASEKFGTVIVRIKGAPKKGSESKMVFAGVVKAGQASKPVALKGLVTVSKFEVFIQYVGLGIEHIIPKGLDHILFVVGLFLLSSRFSSLLWQISSFTIAHTLTLGLAMAGFVSVPSSIVEPLIAASIVYVAVENIFTSKLHRWRPLIVFLFGLLHGLGFASVLSQVGLAPDNFLVGLIGFNIGVEVGQLSVIAVCFLLVGLWFRHKPWYRSYITNPASLLIAMIASYWFIERTFL